MKQDDIKKTNEKSFLTWVEALKSQGKSDEEIGQLLAGVAKLSALEIYAAIMTSLTEDDMKAVEAIPDDEAARARMEELFKERTGMTTSDLADHAQNAIASGFLSQER